MSQPDIVKDFPRVAPDLVAQAGRFQPAIFSDINGRRGALHGRYLVVRQWLGGRSAEL